MDKLGMTNSSFSDEDWINKMYAKSRSERTRTVAKTSLKTFDLFCNHQGLSRDEVIKQYSRWFNPEYEEGKIAKPDIRSICLSLDKFVRFMEEDVKLENEKISKKKSFKTLNLYFGFVKSYLRICHGIKLSGDDIRDYVTFPKQRKVQRIPITLKQLKAIMNNANSRQRALYYVLVSSGVRLGEALTLTKNNLHMDENPVRVTLDPDNTKTKQGRETYISSEAVEKIIPFLEKVQTDDEYIFMNSDNLAYNVSNEDRNFHYLREKLGFMEKYKNSVRYVTNIHSMRAYFHTKASQKHGVEYANSLDGHEGYLEQYYSLTPERRAEMYKELKPELLIESVKIESDTTKNKIMETMQGQMAKMQDEINRLKNYPILVF